VIVELIGLITAYSAVMAILTEDTRRKMPYINAMNFGVTALIALSVKHPLSGVAALAYFIFSTMESNAIASTIDRLKEVESR
jgi:energy-converting hydrogenase A subunit C